MTWFRITVASRVYVRDPGLHLVRDDAGRLLSPDELLASWREVGQVERLPAGIDPESVMRASWVPTSTSRGGNVGFGGAASSSPA